MTNEEVKEIIDRAEDEYDRLKDRVHEQYHEIERLNNIIDKAIEFIIKNENNISSIVDLENDKTYNSALLYVKSILQESDKE